MTKIDQVLTMIGDRVAGTTDEGDVKHLLRVGKPTWLFEASAAGDDRSEQISQSIQAEINQQWKGKPPLSQILMRVLSSPSHPHRLFESLTLSDAFVSETGCQAPFLYKMLDFTDEGLGDQLQVTLLAWTSD